MRILILLPEIVDDYGFTDRVVINSFSGALNEYIHKKYGTKYRQHVFFPQHRLGECAIDPYSYAYCCCMLSDEPGQPMASKTEIERMAARGVQPWVGAGVKTEELVRKAIAGGVYLITSNNPDEVLQWLRQNNCHK